MTKRILALTLAVILLFSFGGCGKGEGGESAGDASASAGFTSWSNDITSDEMPAAAEVEPLYEKAQAVQEVTYSVNKNLLSEADSTFEGTELSKLKWSAFSGGKLSLVNDDTRGSVLYFNDFTANYQSPAIDLYPYVKELNKAGDYRFSFDFKVDENSEDTNYFRAAIRASGEKDKNSFIEELTENNYYLSCDYNIEALEDGWNSAYFDFTVEEDDLDGKPDHVWKACVHHIATTLKGFYIDNASFGLLEADGEVQGEKEVLVTEAQTWVMNEITLLSDKKYSDPVTDALLDIELTNGDTVLTVPGFWDGDNIYRIRFALTKEGTWTYKTICSDTSNTGLNGKTGTINCTKYSGNRAIYQHGFVKAVSGTKYFVYDDGTPFFYLGDTHWTYLTEEFDTVGTRNAGINTTSHFKYIVNKRVSQGYTVYETEPLGATFDLTNGISKADIAGFQQADKYYQYIADMGMVHANAEFFFSSSMSTFNKLENYEEVLETLCRYWVARYGAYPVMWTLAQEIDNEAYYINTIGNDKGAGYKGKTYPFILMARYLAKYDAYTHPLSAHQQGCAIKSEATLLSKGTVASNSSFREEAAHNFWATQWKPKLEAQFDFEVPKDYWENGQGKPAVMYESCYDHLWTNEWGARAEGWLAFVNGMYGYGYGCADMWYYKSSYDMDSDTKRNGITVTKAEKAMVWGDAIELAAGYQMGFMKQLLEQMEWWNLIPRFDDKAYFTADENAYYSVASINENETYVCYFYNENSTATGTVNNLDEAASYIYQWFNPRTGAISTPEKVNKSGTTFAIGARPTQADWVLVITKA